MSSTPIHDPVLSGPAASAVSELQQERMRTQALQARCQDMESQFQRAAAESDGLRRQLEDTRRYQYSMGPPMDGMGMAAYQQPTQPVQPVGSASYPPRGGHARPPPSYGEYQRHSEPPSPLSGGAGGASPTFVPRLSDGGLGSPSPLGPNGLDGPVSHDEQKLKEPPSSRGPVPRRKKQDLEQELQGALTKQVELRTELQAAQDLLQRYRERAVKLGINLDDKGRRPRSKTTRRVSSAVSDDSGSDDTPTAEFGVQVGAAGDNVATQTDDAEAPRGVDGRVPFVQATVAPMVQKLQATRPLRLNLYVAPHVASAIGTSNGAAADPPATSPGTAPASATLPLPTTERWADEAPAPRDAAASLPAGRGRGTWRGGGSPAWGSPPQRQSFGDAEAPQRPGSGRGGMRGRGAGRARRSE